MRVADAASGVLALDAPYGVDLTVGEIDPEWLRAGEVVVQDFAAYQQEGLGFEWLHAATQAASFSPEYTEWVVSRIDRTLRHRDGRVYGAFPAVTFYRVGVYDYSFALRDVRTVLSDTSWEPESWYAHARVAQSFHKRLQGAGGASWRGAAGQPRQAA